MAYRAVVIGAGAIGAGLDDPTGKTRLTHAGGYADHPDFRLVGLADADQEVLARETARWGVPGFSDPRRMLETLCPDVASLCAPTPLHETLAALAMEAGVGGIVCEKPLGPNLAASRRLAGLAEAWGKPFLVHYTRRFVPFYVALRERIRSGEETIQSMCVKYAKGVNHNGSHALDLARFLFGEASLATTLGHRFDFWPDDPTVSAYLRFEGCPEFFLQGLDERRFTFFEADIVTRGGRYLVNEDGFVVNRFAIREHPLYRCRSLGLVEREDTGHGRAMAAMLDHFAQAMAGSVPVRCSVADALAAQELAFALAGQVQGRAPA